MKLTHLVVGIITSFVMSGSAVAQNAKITWLSCDANVVDTYSNGQQERFRERFTLEIEAFPTGLVMFSAETPKVFISVPSRSFKKSIGVINNSSSEVWRIFATTEVKGRKVTQSLKLDRVTGELYFSSTGNVIGTELTGYCEKLESNTKKF